MSIESYTFHSLRLVLNLLIKIKLILSLSLPLSLFLSDLFIVLVYTLLTSVVIDYFRSIESHSLRLVLSLLIKIELILSLSLPLSLLLFDLFIVLVYTLLTSVVIDYFRSIESHSLRLVLSLLIKIELILSLSLPLSLLLSDLFIVLVYTSLTSVVIDYFRSIESHSLRLVLSLLIKIELILSLPPSLSPSI